MSRRASKQDDGEQSSSSAMDGEKSSKHSKLVLVATITKCSFEEARLLYARGGGRRRSKRSTHWTKPLSNGLRLERREERDILLEDDDEDEEENELRAMQARLVQRTLTRVRESFEMRTFLWRWRDAMKKRKHKTTTMNKTIKKSSSEERKQRHKWFVQHLQPLVQRGKVATLTAQAFARWSKLPSAGDRKALVLAFKTWGDVEAAATRRILERRWRQWRTLTTPLGAFLTTLLPRVLRKRSMATAFARLKREKHEGEDEERAMEVHRRRLEGEAEQQRQDATRRRLEAHRLEQDEEHQEALRLREAALDESDATRNNARRATELREAEREEALVAASAASKVELQATSLALRETRTAFEVLTVEAKESEAQTTELTLALETLHELAKRITCRSLARWAQFCLSQAWRKWRSREEGRWYSDELQRSAAAFLRANEITERQIRLKTVCLRLSHDRLREPWLKWASCTRVHYRIHRACSLLSRSQLSRSRRLYSNKVMLQWRQLTRQRRAQSTALAKYLLPSLRRGFMRMVQHVLLKEKEGHRFADSEVAELREQQARLQEDLRKADVAREEQAALLKQVRAEKEELRASLGRTQEEHLQAQRRTNQSERREAELQEQITQQQSKASSNSELEAMLIQTKMELAMLKAQSH